MRSTRAAIAAVKKRTTTPSLPPPPPSPTTSTETILYPPGCKDVTQDMGLDRLIRRLTVLSASFQAMDQGDNTRDNYVPLCLHLAEDGFLQHPNKDVRLVLACCFADILRIYAPEAPYEDKNQVKAIFLFLIDQLKGLKYPLVRGFKRSFYLLENLAYVQSFNMCFELDDADEVVSALFELMFSLVSDEHSGQVKSFMLDMLRPLVSDIEFVPNALLNIILSNILEPVKTSNKSACSLAKELIIQCSETLESYIQNFLNQILICGKDQQDSLFIAQKVYDLIFELNVICPRILLTVIPQLECKLRSTDESERLGSVSLLARMFSEKESILAIDYPPLWQAFIGRFNDVSIAIRIKCVQYSMHFFLNHPELRVEIVAALKLRQHDSEENVRLEVVKAIVATARQDLNIVSESEDLLNYVKERTLDKKFKIRREAVQGLALIYKKHLNAEYVPEATNRAVNWIKDKILHVYYAQSLDDKILVERLMNTCLVPFQLEPYDRMMKLMYLYGTLDANASKAFVEVQKNLLLVRKHVQELLNIIRNDNKEDYDRLLNIRISQLTKFLPDPVKASEFICKFSTDLRNDKNLFRAMEAIVDPATDCKDSAEYTNTVLRKLGAPVMSNLYYTTMKLLLERTSSVIVDKEAVSKLMNIIHQVVSGKREVLCSLGLDKHTALERGLDLIGILAFGFPLNFCDTEILNLLVQLLELVGAADQLKVLEALTYIGKAKRIGQFYRNVMETLVPQCQTMLITGSPKHSKQAVRCLAANMNESARNHTFSQVVEALKASLDPDNNNYRTAIVALGHIALLMPNEFKSDMKSIIAKKIVKELLINPRHDYELSDDESSESWCDEEELPEITRCMIAGLKTTARWLMGLKSDIKAAIKTFKMLAAFVETGGEFINSMAVPFSNAEKAWLRLTAGCCMLKICEQKGVGDQFNAEQFYALSNLMNDDVLEVRSRFALKLHLGLSRGIPHMCLPLDFMGYYSLAGYDQNKKQRATVHSYMMRDIEKRQEYIRCLLRIASDRAAEQIPHIMPDYMLVFSVTVLTHNPKFTEYSDRRQLDEIVECLWFILEPLTVQNDNYSYAFYNTLIEKMKNHKDALEPADAQVLCKMYACCDIAHGLILQRSSCARMALPTDYPSEPRIPPMYFKRNDDPLYKNTQTYLPADMQFSEPKRIGEKRTASAVAENSNTQPRKRINLAKDNVDKHGNVSIDAKPNDANEARLQTHVIMDDGNDKDNEQIPVGVSVSCTAKPRKSARLAKRK